LTFYFSLIPDTCQQIKNTTRSW